jgi:hypothetical protein
VAFDLLLPDPEFIGALCFRVLGKPAGCCARPGVTRERLLELRFRELNGLEILIRRKPVGFHLLHMEVQEWSTEKSHF